MTNKLEKRKKPEISEKQKQIDNDFEILKAVNVAKPKEADKKAYFELIERKPELLDCMMSLQSKAETDILNQECSFLMAEKTKVEIKKMRDALGWQDATEIEKLLIEQICLNYVRVNLLEATHCQKLKESHSFETGSYWDKRLSSAQQRILRACETLAKVRRLLSEANLQDERARHRRAQSAALANKTLQDLTR